MKSVFKAIFQILPFLGTFTLICLSGCEGTIRTDFSKNVSATGTISSGTKPLQLVFNNASLKFSSAIPNGTSPMTVSVLDGEGQIAADYSSPITLSILENPGSGVLSGTLSVTPIEGTATFSNLSIDKIGLGYTLMAESGVLKAYSLPFSVQLGPLDHFDLIVPSTQVTAGTAGSITVVARDHGNNVKTDFTGNVTLTSTDGSATLPSCTFQSVGVSVCPFTLNLVGIQSLTFTSGSVSARTTLTVDSPTSTSGTSVSATLSSVSLSPASPSQVVANGTATATVTVTLVDAGSNPVSGKTVAIIPIRGSAIDTISPALASSNASGQAVFTIKSSTPGSAQLLTSVSPDGITLPLGSNLPTVTFVDTAPTLLSYATGPVILTKNETITPINPTASGGSITQFSISPALPLGLFISPTLGTIAGTPTAMTSTATYTITGSNSGGSTTANLNITVRDQAPSALAYAVNPVAYTKTIPVSPNSPTSSGGVVTAYSVSPPLPAGLSLNTSTGILTGTPTALASAANYTITATNTGGSATASLNISVNNIAPSNLSYGINPAIYVKGSAIATNSPTASGGAIESYSVTPNLPTGLSLNTSTGDISGTPSAISVATSYLITATNTGGSTTTNLAITVNDVGLSSLSYIANPATYTIGTPITNNTPSVSGGLATAYSVSPSLPAGLSLNTSTGVVSGTPSALSPTAFYIVTASNSNGSTAVNLSVAVNDLPPTGLSYLNSSATYVSGIPINNNTATVSGGGAVTSYSVSPSLPTGLSLLSSSGTITGTPVAATSAASYTVSANNSGGSTSAVLNITVDPAPMISILGSPFKFTQGVPISTVTPTVVGATTVSISPNLNSNTGLTLNTSTGAISGTPSTVQTPTAYILTASNATGQNATATLNLAVYAPPSISFNGSPFTFIEGYSILPINPTLGSSVSSVTASPALPQGISLGLLTGTIAGGPTAPSPLTTYTLTASNLAGAVTTTTVDIAVVGPAATSNSTIVGSGSVIADGTDTATVTITLKDASNSPVPGFVPIFSATDTGGANTYSTCTAASSFGVSTCALKSTVAEIKTLQLLSPVIKTGGTVNFVPGDPYKLFLATTLNNGAAGATLLPLPSVVVQDAYGNTVTTTSSSPISFTLDHAAGATLLGTASIYPTAGVATFSGLSVDKAGSGYTLTATSSGLLPVTSNPFSLTPAPGFGGTSSVTPLPVTLVADGTASSTITILLRDTFTNPVAGKTITLSSSRGSSDTIAPASAGSEITDVNGAATFTVSSTRSGVAVLSAFDSTDGVLIYPSAATVTFTPGDATKLTFSTEPGGTPAGLALVPQPSVTVQDINGNTVTASTASISLTFDTNAGGGTLSGTQSLNATAGVATFSGLSIDKAGVGYKLAAASPGLTSAASTAFTIAPGVVVAATSTVVPSPSYPTAVVADGTPVTITVTLRDLNSNPVPGKSVTLASSRPTLDTISTSSGPSNGSGIVTFTVSSTTAGNAVFTATDTTGSQVITPSVATVNFVPGPLAGVTIVSGDSQTATVGTILTNPLVVKVIDANGNSISGTTVTWSVTTPAGGGSLSGTLNPTNSSGQSSTSWTLGTVSGQNTLTASSGGFTATFHATGTPSSATHLTFGTQPSSTGNTDSALAIQPIVLLKDAYNNTVDTTNPISLQAYSDTSCSTVVTGGLTVTNNPESAVSGVATFTGARILKTSVIRLGASSIGLPPICSASLSIAPGIPSIVLAVKSGQKNTILADGLMTTVIQATATDLQGNQVPNTSISLSSSTNGGSFTSPAVTNSAGIAEFTVTSSTVLGTYSYVANSGSETSSPLFLNFVAGAIVTNITSSATNGNYVTGQNIPIQLTFNSNVIVTGTPRLTLSGATSPVSYSGGTGTNTLTFSYMIESADHSTLLDYASSSALNLNSGSILDSNNGLPVDLTLINPGTGSPGAGALSINKVLTVNGITITLPSNRLFPLDGNANPPAIQLSTIVLPITATGSGTVTLSCTYQTVGLATQDPNTAPTPVNCSTLPTLGTTNSTLVVKNGVFTQTSGTNSATGQITWTPTSTQRGTYQFNLSVTDAAETQTRQLYVSARDAYDNGNYLAIYDPLFGDLGSSAPLTSTPSRPHISSNSNNSSTQAFQTLLGSSLGDLTYFNNTSPYGGTGQTSTSSLDPYALNFVAGGSPVSSDVLEFSSDPLANMTRFSVQAWIKPSAPMTAGSVIVSNQDAFNQGFAIRQGSSGVVEFAVGASSCQSTTKVSASRWDFMQGYYDGTNAQFSINGRQECSFAVTNSLSASATLVGAAPGVPNTNFWSGALGFLGLNGTNLTPVNTAKTTFDATANRFRVTPIENIITSNLVLSLDAANANGGTATYPSGCASTDLTWFDLSTSFFNGTAINFAPANCSTAGWTGTGTPASPFAMSFNAGNSQYIALPNMTLNLSAGITVEAWVNPFGTNFWERFLDLGTGMGRNNILLSRYANAANQFNLSIYDSTGSSTNVIGTGLSNNTWQHIVATAAPNGAISLYRNGAAAGSGTGPSVNYSITRTSNYIGRSNFTGDSYFSGAIAVERIYNRVLSLQEIKQNCLAQERRFTTTPQSICAAP